MYQITVGVEGMACEMCEAHVNEAVRKAFDVKKVTSYQTTSFESAPYEKKGFFAKLFG